MHALFRNNKTNTRTTLYENGNTKLYFLKLNQLSISDIANWTKNRPPDNVRIEQIRKYYQDNNVDLVPGIVSAWKKDNYYIVYDGIHRLLAAYQYSQDMSLVLQVNSTVREQDIIDDFLNINKSVSVPSIYLEETDTLKKLVCQNVANEMCRRYSRFVSPSRKPYVYNFNRDNLVEFVSSFNIDFTKQGVDSRIINEFVGLNKYAEDFIRRNNIKPSKKCDDYRFYLWYLEKDLIKKKIEMSLNN